jgi:hypothetical protein
MGVQMLHVVLLDGELLVARLALIGLELHVNSLQMAFENKV